MPGLAPLFSDRADEEHQQACVERERAILAEEQLATLQLASPEKKKKKKKVCWGQ